MAFLNTPHSGNVRSIIFQENGEWFGVALEFNIVETGTSPQEVSVLLDEAIQGYIEAAQKSKHSIRVLNQDVDPEYESLWEAGNSDREEDRNKVYKLSAQQIPALV
jgi:predicted RNase H-like HicB family nuclease